ncbi:MAG: helix-turn-helix domain-containing protein [Anaerolineales bacterium]|nr:MAG: helix-turn-helix domain-containing protein [Anaerolineales bacterium]
MSLESHFPESLLKASQVAKILNISRAFAYQLMQKGILPTVKILGARRVRPEDLNRFIQERVSQSGQKGIK